MFLQFLHRNPLRVETLHPFEILIGLEFLRHLLVSQDPPSLSVKTLDDVSYYFLLLTPFVKSLHLYIFYLLISNVLRSESEDCDNQTTYRKVHKTGWICCQKHMCTRLVSLSRRNKK